MFAIGIDEFMGEVKKRGHSDSCEDIRELLLFHFNYEGTHSSLVFWVKIMY